MDGVAVTNPFLSGNYAPIHGMVHGFYVEDGKVGRRNRYVRTPRWKLEHEAGRSLFASFNPSLADPPSKGQDSAIAKTPRRIPFGFHGT